MKKTVFAIGFTGFLFCSSLGFAQMGSGMKGSQTMDTNHVHTMEHATMMEHGTMMGRDTMMSDMKGMSNQMSEVMGKMSGMIKDMPQGNMKMMSDVMKDISNQMMDMSTANSGGKTSAEGKKKMHDRMMEIQKKISEMEMHK